MSYPDRYGRHRRPGLISTVELCRATGLSYRQISYWAAAGVLQPEQPARGSGSQIGWNPADIRIARRLRTLTGLTPKVPVALAAQVAAALTNADPDEPWVAIPTADRHAVLLVANVDSPPDWRTCPHIATAAEGTSYCTLSTSVGPITEAGLVAFAERSTNHA